MCKIYMDMQNFYILTYMCVQNIYIIMCFNDI